MCSFNINSNLSSSLSFGGAAILQTQTPNEVYTFDGNQCQPSRKYINMIIYFLYFLILQLNHYIERSRFLLFVTMNAFPTDFDDVLQFLNIQYVGSLYNNVDITNIMNTKIILFLFIFSIISLIYY